MTEQGRAVQIVDLRDAIQHRKAVVEQNYDLWGKMTDITYAQMDDLFTADNPKGTLPVTLIALRGDEYVGCVSLREETMGMLTHPEAYLDETPWLSNMWVADAERGNKLASQLTLAVEDAARAHGYKQLFLATLKPDSLYHKLDYENITQKELNGSQLYLVQKQIGEAA